MKRKREAPHFFKIILNKTLKERKLRIPPMFVKNYGNDIPSEIVVKDPAGNSSEMGVCRYTSGEVWMQKGWDKFAKNYSLRYAHLLVFRYEGNGHFYVSIFDTTASEINYPYFSGAMCEASGSKGGFQEDDIEDDAEFLNSKPRRGKSVGNSGFPCSVPPLRRSLRMMNKDITLSTSAENDWDFRYHSRTSAGGGKVTKVATRCKAENVVRRLNQCSSNAQRKAKALQRARAFVSENPFCIIAMPPSSINPAKQVIIPIAFAEQHLGLTPREVVLRVSNRSWTVVYRLEMSNGRRRGFVIRSNWRSFVRDNNLNTGDVCVFELLKSQTTIMKVTIFRVMEESHRPSAGSCYENAMIETNHKISSVPETECDDDYDIEGRPYKGCEAQEHRFLHGRKAEDYDDDDVSIEILDNNSPCKNKRRKLPSSPSLSTSKIKRNSSFLSEDCEPEGASAYVPHSDMDKVKHQQISIIANLKHDGTSFDKDGTGEAPGGEIHGMSPSDDEKAKAHERFSGSKFLQNAVAWFKELTLKNSGSEDIKSPKCASNQGDINSAIDFVSIYPFFRVVLSEYSLVNQFLHIPAWFMLNFKGTEEYVKLRVKGESWPVELVRVLNATVKGLVQHITGRLSTGWSAFCSENSLRAGDVCVFELITAHDDVVLNVTILQQSAQGNKYALDIET